MTEDIDAASSSDGPADDCSLPPAGFWEQTHELLRHERELWADGIDAPAWWSSGRETDRPPGSSSATPTDPA